MSPICKVTGTRGRGVSETTLSHLLREEALPQAQGPEWFFCSAPECDVVYFTANGEKLAKDALRVRVGMKEDGGHRPICYCFDFSFEDLERDVTASGTSTLPDQITEQCRQGLDRCEETNPQGSCCLGNVRKALKDTQARSVNVPSERSEDEGAHDCCKPQARKVRS